MKDFTVESTVLVALLAGAIAKFAFGILMRRNRRRKMVKVGMVTALNIYPIKSCRGIPVKAGHATFLGLKIGDATDRHWLVVRSNGDFVTQRQYSKMALIKTNVQNSFLVIEAPSMPTLKVPLRPVTDRSKVMNCRVWESRIEGLDCGDDAAFWFSTFLGAPGLRVLFSASDLKRQDMNSIEKDWESFTQSGDQSAFPDFSGYLVTTDSSLAALNSRLKSPIPMIRFRPIIVIGGCPEFDEDTWQEIQIGDSATFRMLDPCTRCLMTTVNPDIGERDPTGEPLETLKQFRCYPKYGTAPLFGVNATIDFEGNIKVGDPVYAIRK